MALWKKNGGGGEAVILPNICYCPYCERVFQGLVRFGVYVQVRVGSGLGLILGLPPQVQVGGQKISGPGIPSLSQDLAIQVLESLKLKSKDTL